MSENCAWAARCECYAGGPGHSPNSGRCGCRHDGRVGHGVLDPTAKSGEPALCESCRKICLRKQQASILRNA